MPDLENKIHPGQQATIVTFRLESQTYALPINLVRQIIDMVTITPLPQIDHTVAGVINFHGALVPVVHLRRYLNLDEAPLQSHTPIILAWISKRLVGLIVDQVMDVLDRAVDQIIDPSNILPKEMGEIPLLQGLIQSREGSILLLNLDHLFEPYHARALIEAVDSLAQNTEDGAPVKADVPQSLETTSHDKQNAEKAMKNEPVEQPAKSSKRRSRKKANASPETPTEMIE